jgi:hypothetical protein
LWSGCWGRNVDSDCLGDIHHHRQEVKVPAGACALAGLLFSYLLVFVDKSKRLDILQATLGGSEMPIEVVGHKKLDNELFVTVQGANVDEVTSTTARHLAYNERGKHGYETAGMEQVGGAYPVDHAKLLKGATEEDAVCDTGEKMKNISTRRGDLRYRQQFRFKRSI